MSTLMQDFDKQQKWFDNKKYQRENHETACKMLKIINPDVPKILYIHREKNNESECQLNSIVLLVVE